MSNARRRIKVHHLSDKNANKLNKINQGKKLVKRAFVHLCLSVSHKKICHLPMNAMIHIYLN